MPAGYGNLGRGVTTILDLRYGYKYVVKSTST